MQVRIHTAVFNFTNIFRQVKRVGEKFGVLAKRELVCFYT